MKDAASSAQAKVERLWKSSREGFQSRKAFESSHVVDHIWAMAAPLWWGLNDVIGFVDIRLMLDVPCLDAALFLTAQRPSRRLTAKQYVCRRHEEFRLEGGQGNHELQAGVLAAVERLAADPALSERHLPLDDWRIMVAGTNLVGVIRDFAEQKTLCDRTRNI
jgi:hypothetical protein